MILGEEDNRKATGLVSATKETNYDGKQKEENNGGSWMFGGIRNDEYDPDLKFYDLKHTGRNLPARAQHHHAN